MFLQQKPQFVYPPVVFNENACLINLVIFSQNLIIYYLLLLFILFLFVIYYFLKFKIGLLHKTFCM